MEMIATESNKFVDPLCTARGEPRASVAVSRLETLWLNTGTLCNLTCENCYIESSPRNDALGYLTRAEVRSYLAEISAERLPVSQIGITGGEPFMNPDILTILEDCLERGFRVVVLTNAMRPMMKCADGLQRLAERFGPRLTVRVSLDHPDPARHEEERGRRSWQPTIEGLKWLGGIGVELNVAGRTRWGEDESVLRAGFETLFHREGIPVDAWSNALVLFPEMDERADVPEITTACWSILGVDPASLMCSSARMVVKRKGAPHPEVVACTLLPYDTRFRLGSRLVESLGPVALNHPHCAKFCVLGGGSCAA